MRILKKKNIGISCFFLFLFYIKASSLTAHDQDNSRGINVVDWPLENISRVLSAGYPDSLGLFAFTNRKSPTSLRIAGHHCVNSSFLAFDVDDEIAFDINESVELELLFDARDNSVVNFTYDKNGVAEEVGTLPAGNNNEAGLKKVVVELEHARFANRGMSGTDIALVARGSYFPEAEGESSSFTLCGLAIKRTNSSAQAKSKGRIDIRILDKLSRTSIPARMGIYDQNMRSVLPAKDALLIKFYDDELRNLKLNSGLEWEQYWPVSNRYIFYTDGRYRDELAVGNYVLIVAKGPEYEIEKIEFKVGANSNTALTVEMKRWIDMPAQHWYSGDVHIHIGRNKSENSMINKFMQAEDVHLSNILEMNNPENSHFRQYAWGASGRYRDSDYFLVPGIESPRTALRGHVLNLNIQKPISIHEDYFLYHRFLEEYAKQGAISGYAHVGSEEFFASRGLALDVPFGLVDFVEILQSGSLRTEIWYDFLNLGFQLSPAAGSDFPYFDQPGAVRSYARIENKPDTQAWFDALAAGHTFVTTGPLLEFRVDDREMGSKLKRNIGDTVSIKASAKMNPTFEDIKTLELVSCGEVIRSIDAGSQQKVLSLNEELLIDESMWLAIRANSAKHGIAHSAPIYVDAGGGRSWCKDKVAATARKMQESLNELGSAVPVLHRELEYWEINELQSIHSDQLPSLRQRIRAASKKYQELAMELQLLENNK